jgi:hypothetical protein
MSSQNTVELLDEILAPVGDCLDEGAARALVNLRASPKAQDRVDLLAAKSNEGTLTPEESAEYEALIWASNFIAVLQAKARKRLAA